MLYTIEFTNTYEHVVCQSRHFKNFTPHSEDFGDFNLLFKVTDGTETMGITVFKIFIWGNMSSNIWIGN